jgi:nucleotide-binding universal stress UspA family protein
MSRPPCKVPPEHILVPIDASAPDALATGELALTHAVALAGARGRITMVCAEKPAFPFGGVEVPRELETAVRAAEDARNRAIGERMQAMAAHARARGATVSVSLLAGTGGEAERVVEAADKLAVDLIVMTTHARGGVQRLFLGSVAERIAHLSTTPVLLVPAALAPAT